MIDLSVSMMPGKLRLQSWNHAVASQSEYPLALFLSPGTPISRSAFDLSDEPRTEPTTYPRLATAIGRSPAKTCFLSQPLPAPGFVRPPIIEFRVARRRTHFAQVPRQLPVLSTWSFPPT